MMHILAAAAWLGCFDAGLRLAAWGPCCRHHTYTRAHNASGSPLVVCTWPHPRGRSTVFAHAHAQAPGLASRWPGLCARVRARAHASQASGQTGQRRLFRCTGRPCMSAPCAIEPRLAPLRCGAAAPGTAHTIASRPAGRQAHNVICTRAGASAAVTPVHPASSLRIVSTLADAREHRTHRIHVAANPGGAGVSPALCGLCVHVHE